MYRSVVAGYLRSEGRGLVFVLVLFLLAMAAPSFGALFSRYMPTSYWIEVGPVQVYDALAGEDPPMHAGIVVKRDFRGDRIAVVKRRGVDGFSWYCAGAAENDFATDETLPDPLTLSTWLWPGRCDLKPGYYRLDTLWRIRTSSGQVRELRSRSNVFEIHRVAASF